MNMLDGIMSMAWSRVQDESPTKASTAQYRLREKGYGDADHANLAAAVIRYRTEPSSEPGWVLDGEDEAHPTRSGKG